MKKYFYILLFSLFLFLPSNALAYDITFPNVTSDFSDLKENFDLDHFLTSQYLPGFFTTCTNSGRFCDYAIFFVDNTHVAITIMEYSPDITPVLRYTMPLYASSTAKYQRTFYYSYDVLTNTYTWISTKQALRIELSCYINSNTNYQFFSQTYSWNVAPVLYYTSFEFTPWLDMTYNDITYLAGTMYSGKFIYFLDSQPTLYDITFQIPTNSTLVVKNSNNEIITSSNNIYSLESGDYTYSLTESLHESLIDVPFSVTSSQTITLELESLIDLSNYISIFNGFKNYILGLVSILFNLDNLLFLFLISLSVLLSLFLIIKKLLKGGF